MMQQDTDYTRLFITLFIVAIIMMGWQAFIEAPRRQALEQYHAQQQTFLLAEQKKQATQLVQKDADTNPLLTREERLAISPRITINSPALHGSIALKGAKFDDLKLAAYRETLDAKSSEVTLLSPSGDKEAYIAQAGWVSPDGATKVPDQHTLWQADRKTLETGKPVTLRWDNGQGITFVITIALDDAYMFTLTQRVENNSGAPAHLAPYAYINRSYTDNNQHVTLVHEGPLGVFENTLYELNYKKLREDGNKSYENSSGWLGITDKYWQVALIPGGTFNANFSYYSKEGKDRYQTDYLGQDSVIAAGQHHTTTLRLFAGAKEIKQLDRYTTGDEKNPPIPLFERSVDFGILYFLTKPMLHMLTFFYDHIGNVGLAIMMLTIVVKLLMFPLANKSYVSMAHLRELQPEMTKLRDKYFDDRIRLNQEMMALYKREKVNPAAGCLPLLIQMPVFFALYKVLYVSIEMRHAPFFSWLKDLSAPDPSNLFTAFGLLPWNAPDWLHLGVLPILMCATMVVQMRQQPKPSDPVQAAVIKYMPYMFLFLFARFAAGLVLYWVWSNILSILQQEVISRRHHAAMEKKKRKAAA